MGPSGANGKAGRSARNPGVRKTVRKTKDPTHFAHHPVSTRSVAMQSFGGVDFGNGSGDNLDAQLSEYLKKAAGVLADYIRAEAAKFSRRIPGTVEVAEDHAVHVKAGGPPAPNAYPFDPPSNPPVWHPVFARGPRHRWNWAPQPYRPFMEEGASKGSEAAAEKFADIVDEWTKDLGTDRPT